MPCTFQVAKFSSFIIHSISHFHDKVLSLRSVQFMCYFESNKNILSAGLLAISDTHTSWFWRGSRYQSVAGFLCVQMLSNSISRSVGQPSMAPVTQPVYQLTNNGQYEEDMGYR